MRMLLKATMDTEAANEAARAGTLGKTIESIVADLKPEAADFVAIDGKRTALIFFDMQDPSELPRVAEPWFLAFNASLEVQPAMVAADLEKAGPSIREAVQRYG